jgi:branched-chain amino acid transport system ATP-binding protein
MLLNLKEIKVCYGKVQAIKGVTIEVVEGSITGIVGANGAGKSTIMKAISGLLPITGGEMWFKNKKINGMSSHAIVKMGIIQVPERRRLFPYMTVMENIRMGAYLRKDKTGIKEDMDKIWQRFPILRERHNQQASTLSGGEQQMLAIGRALMAKPKLLLLDEPSLGLAPIMCGVLATIIREINETGISILLVEQNAGLSFSLSNKTYVLELGKVIMEGNTKEIMNHETLVKVYLGG